MSSPQLFEIDTIENHENAYEKAKDGIEYIAGENGNTIAMVVGYHEETDEYEFAMYGEFGTPEDAKYACIAIKNYYWALQEIKRLRERVKVVTEAALKDRDMVAEFIVKWKEDK